MNKERFEWIMSGLSRYNLNGNEDRLVKLVAEGFSQKNKITEEQEAKMESLYKEKSKLWPDKHPFSTKKSEAPEKKKPRKFRIQNIH